MSYDQFWSFFAMPIGLLLCFGPAVAAWLVAERKHARSQSNGPKSAGPER